MIWILHQNAGARQALCRLCGAYVDELVFGSPADPQFTLGTAPAPDLVVLGAAEPFDVELSLAQLAGERFPFARWLILTAASDLERARALFDALPAQFESWPPTPAVLARQFHPVSEAAATRPLSSRIRRAQLETRFERWFGGLPLPEYRLTLDPRWWNVPVLIYGEAGTGRALLAHAVAELTPDAPDSKFLRVGEHNADAATLEGEFRTAIANAPHRLCLWLDRVDRFDPALQAALAHWIEAGPPGISVSRVRWIATCAETPLMPPPALTSALYTALAGITLRTPPLREDPKRSRHFAEATVRAYGGAQGVGAQGVGAQGGNDRRLSEKSLAWIEADAWPGNLRELESLLLRNLLHSDAEEIDLIELDREHPAPPSAEASPPPEETEAKATLPAHLAPTAYLPESSVQRLFGALVHEIGNPLVTLQTFVDLLPSRFQDSSFRNQFVKLVSPDARRIGHVVEQLRQFAAFRAPQLEPVDLSALLDALLEEVREAIGERHLSVLREFDPESARCIGDRAQLRFAFGAILRTMIDILPEREHLDLLLRTDPPSAATRRVHFAMRFRDREEREDGSGGDALSITNNTLALVVTDAIAMAHGGNLERRRADGGEVIIEIELPAA